MTNEVIDMPAAANTALQERPQTQVAVQGNGPDALLAIAVQRGASVEELERLLALKERVDASVALKAYNEAFANFKQEAVKIVRTTSFGEGPLKNKKYADLHAFVDALVPALSKHGLSHSWKLTKDDKDWLEVTCFLKHVGGHVESASMGGPPDTGGAKNAIQARASSKTFFERQTFKAITGVAEQDDDDDGNGGKGNGPAEAQRIEQLLADLTAKVEATKTDKDALEFWRANGVQLKASAVAYDKFTQAVAAHRRALKEAA